MKLSAFETLLDVDLSSEDGVGAQGDFLLAVAHEEHVGAEGREVFVDVGGLQAVVFVLG